MIGNRAAQKITFTFGNNVTNLDRDKKYFSDDFSVISNKHFKF